MWRVLVPVMLELCVACHAGYPAAPAQGGPVWTELTSEHFTVWTDGDPSRVCELIRTMERFHQVTAGVAYPTAPTAGRALAVVMRNSEELSEVNNLGEARAMTHTAGAPLWQPLVLLSLTDTEERTMAHELTHLVSFAVIHHQPRWLSEGMAAYFESAQLAADGTMVTLGVAPARYGSILPPVPISMLFDWGRMSSLSVERPLYQTAWALFAFLINEHKAELAHYLWLLDHITDHIADRVADRTGDAADRARQRQQRAWDQAFPSLPVEALDHELGQWLTYGSHQVLRFYVHPRDARITARRLSDADAYAVRSYLFDGPTADQRERGRAERSRALALEPTNVLAWVLQASYGEKPSAGVGRAIAAAHPDDWRAWWLAAIALEDNAGDPSELDHARSQACERIARNRALQAPPRLCPAGIRASVR
jgi:hypothetical protein